MRRRKLARAALAVLAVLTAAAPARAADPASTAAPAEGKTGGRLPPAPRKAGVNATATLEASGTFARTGEQSAFFAGALAGTFDVQDPPGDAAPLDGAALLCPGIFLVDLSNRFQEAEGRCTLTTQSGDQAFADFECGGDEQGGCRGAFEISGGSGALAGIDGGGDFKIQGGVAPHAAKALGQRIESAAAGSATWSRFILTIP